MEKTNVIDTQGKLVSLPNEQVQQALDAGFTLPNQKDLDSFAKDQKNDSTSEQVKGFLEGTAESLSGGLSTGLETHLLNVNPEDIARRRETTGHTTGQIAGLVGPGIASSLLGKAGLPIAAKVISALAPESALLEKAGSAAAGLIPGTGFLSKIGSTAAKFAAENAIVQSQDEVSKMLSHETDSSTFWETALPNIGMSALIGAGIGGTLGTGIASWHALKGGETGEILGLVKDRMDGNPIVPSRITDAAKNAGIELDPVIKAGLSDKTLPREEFQHLLQDPAVAGKYVQSITREFKGAVNNKLLDALGKTPDSVQDFSKYEAGKKLTDDLMKSINERAEPIKDLYAKVEDSFANHEVDNFFKDNVEQKIGDLIQENHWDENPKMPSNKFAQEAISNIPNWKTLEGVRSAIIDNNKIAFTDPARYAAGKVNEVLENAIQERIGTTLSGENPELFNKWKEANEQWGELKNDMGELSQRLKLGNVKGMGPSTFLQKLESKLTGENVFNKLVNPKDAEFFGDTLHKFPEVMDSIKDFHLNQLMDKAVYRGPEGFELNPTKFFEKFNDATPELRNFVFNPEMQTKINSLQDLWKTLPAPKNTSWTAPVLAKMMKGTPGTVVGMISAIVGHNPVVSVLLSNLTTAISSELPSSMKLSLLKFLGSSGEIDALGFKNMTSAISSAMKGENQLVNSAKAVFQAGREVIPAALMSSQERRDKLDKTLLSYQEDPSKLMNLSNAGSSYLNNHNVSRSFIAQNVVSTLNSMRPLPAKISPLDKDLKPTPMQKASFDRVLDFAEQPLLVLHHIKQGTLQTSDVNLVKTIAPNLYNRMADKLTHEMVDHTSKGNPIPYQTQLGLSKFLGQPMVSSALPQSMMQIQQAFMTKPQSQQSQQPPQKKSRSGSLKNIGDVAKLEGNDTQRRSISRWD